MKYISFIVISTLLCATHSFDMKYSLQKHKWNDFIPNLITSGNIDKHTTIIYRETENKVSLKSTDLESGVTLSDSYILAANFQIIKAGFPTCLFSMDRKGVRKLALCIESAGDDAVTITLDSANIPDGKLKFDYKIKYNEWTQLLLSVNKSDVTQIINCQVIEEKQLNKNITDLLRLTDDMDLTLVTGSNFEIKMRDLDIYSPIDVTTIMSLCPNLKSPQLQGETGEKGDKGDMGERGDRGPKGENGSKGDVGERGIGLMGPPGARGYSGDKGDKGDKGPYGQPGFTGMKGDSGYPGMTGQKGDRGEPGLPAPPAPSCPAAVAPPAPTAELEVLKSILGEIKSIFHDFIVEKKEQMKYFTEINKSCNERLIAAERNIVINTNNIDAIKNAMLTEAQL